MKTGRQCANCLITVHKKCQEKFNNENICLHVPISTKSIIPEDETSMTSTDDIDAQTPTTTDRFSTARRTLRKLRNRNLNETFQPELSKNDESDRNSSPHTEKRQSVQTSSKFVNAASSAYSKLREFKTKRTTASELKQRRLSLDSSTHLPFLFY
jgi:hypothetical protein